MINQAKRDPLCTLHDGTTWGHLMDLTWQIYLKKTLPPSYMTELPTRDILCTIHEGSAWGHFLHVSWRTYPGTLCLPYMTDLLNGIFCVLNLTDLPGTPRAPYMTELAWEDTSFNLHNRHAWRGHFVNLTWRNYWGTLHLPYIYDGFT